MYGTELLYGFQTWTRQDEVKSNGNADLEKIIENQPDGNEKQHGCN